MTYTTTMTSKGTITIAAPLRKAFRFVPGQQLSLSINNHQLVIHGGTSVAEFEALRTEITKKIPNHKKRLTGQAL